MRKWLQLNRILWKQYLMRHRIWFAALPAVWFLLLALGRLEVPQKDEGIRAGVYAEDMDGEKLLLRLQEEEGIFSFLGFEEKEDMLRQIENGSLECGFELPEGFYENMIKGRVMRQITLYYTPSSTAHKISYEVVFSHLFTLLSDQVLNDYMDFSAENGVFTKEEGNLEKLLKLKGQYAENGSTFSFIYEQVGEERETEAVSLNTMKGCIAVMIFLMSLLGLADCLELDKVLLGLSRRNRMKVMELHLHISLFGSVVLGGILLLLSGTGNGFLKEITGLLFYFVILEIYIRFLKLFIRKAEAVYGLIPVFILGSLLFCPVFIQMKAYLPAAALIEKLFPVSYYLNLP